MYRSRNDFGISYVYNFFTYKSVKAFLSQFWADSDMWNRCIISKKAFQSTSLCKKNGGFLKISIFESLCSTPTVPWSLVWQVAVAIEGDSVKQL